VAYQKLSQLYAEGKEEEMSRFITALVKKLFYFMTIPFLVIILTSKYYIPILFGETWLELYKYFYVLSIIVYASLLMIPIGHLLKIYTLQNISLQQHFFIIAMKIFALLIALLFKYSFLKTVFIISIFHTIALYINVVRTFTVTNLEMPLLYHGGFLFLFLYIGGIYFVI
jgi:O-antigen/teichoic acid export membrane protein